MYINPSFDIDRTYRANAFGEGQSDEKAVFVTFPSEPRARVAVFRAWCSRWASSVGRGLAVLAEPHQKSAAPITRR